MKTFWMLLVALAGVFLPGRLDAQENGDEQSGRPPVRRFGFGISVSSYPRDYAELDRAYSYAEDQYRNQGYSIDTHSHDFGAAPLLWFTLRFRPSIPIGVLLEAGTSLDPDRVNFKAASASVLYFPPIARKSFEPYLGAGIGRYQFSATRSYGEGNRISPETGNGTYTYLDRIESEGGGIGSKLMIGVDLSNPSSRVRVGAFMSYLVMLGSVEGAIPNGPNVKIDMDGLLVGGRILIDL